MLIKVKVFPNSRKQEIQEKSNNSLIVFVKSKPKDNQANFEMLSLVSDKLGVPISKIRIIKGAKEQNKIIQIP